MISSFSMGVDQFFTSNIFNYFTISQIFFLYSTLVISFIYPKVLVLSEASELCKFVYININLKCSWLIYISCCTVTNSYIIFIEILSTLHKTYITFFGLIVRQNYASFLVSETLFSKVHRRARQVVRGQLCSHPTISDLNLYSWRSLRCVAVDLILGKLISFTCNHFSNCQGHF